VNDARDYDVEYYVRVLRESFATRLERAVEPEHFAALFDDPLQLSLFGAGLARARPVLTRRARIEVGELPPPVRSLSRE
jgi:uncharacterized membrane protein